MFPTKMVCLHWVGRKNLLHDRSVIRSGTAGPAAVACRNLRQRSRGIIALAESTAVHQRRRAEPGFVRLLGKETTPVHPLGCLFRPDERDVPFRYGRRSNKTIDVRKHTQQQKKLSPSDHFFLFCFRRVSLAASVARKRRLFFFLSDISARFAHREFSKRRVSCSKHTKKKKMKKCARSPDALPPPNAQVVPAHSRARFLFCLVGSATPDTQTNGFERAVSVYGPSK